MKKIIAYIGSLLAVAALQVSSAAESTVKAWEENVEIPTYVLDAPEAAPIFDCDWSYQPGAALRLSVSAKRQYDAHAQKCNLQSAVS